jgi:hypothetical protein
VGNLAAALATSIVALRPNGSPFRKEGATRNAHMLS